MKVLHIIQRYPPAIGGAEVWCRNVCRYLSSQNVETRVATINLFNIEEFFRELSDSEKFVALGDHDLDDGVSVRRYKLSSFAQKGFFANLLKLILYETGLNALELTTIIRHSPHSRELYLNLFKEVQNADIVHLHTLPYFHTLAGFWVAKLLRKKIVVTPHFHPGNPYYEKKIFFNMLARCDSVISMSQYEKDYLIKKGIASDKIQVVGNSILNADFADGPDFEAFRSALYRKYGIAESAKKIIFLGRKEPYKGIQELREAARQLAEEGDRSDDLCLFLVGPSTSLFEKEMSEFKGTPKLKLIDFGSVTEREKHYLLKISDVLVLPSLFEAFGIVFLEAWKYKKPVIGSNKGAIPEVIRNAGLCAEYGNVRDLKEKIKMVLENKALALTLGQAGKEKLDTEYSFETIGKKVWGVYRDLIKPRKTVLVVSNLFPPYFTGGSEIVAYYQSKRLKEMGYDIRVFAGKLDNRQKRYGVRKERGEFDITRVNLHSRDFDCFSMNFDKPALQTEFRKAIHEINPDMVHFHNIYSFSVRMIEECVKANIPTLMTLHDYWGICYKNILVTDGRNLCDKAGFACKHCRENFYFEEGNKFPLEERNRLFIECLNKIDLLTAPSAFLLDQYRKGGVLAHKSALVKYGIDVEAFRGLRKSQSDTIRFGYIGQVIEHKGTDILLRSIGLLAEQYRKKISVTIVGGGEDMFIQYCKSLVSELKIQDCVRFAGKVSNNDIKKIFTHIDALIVTSVWFENSPVVILESLASGTPVLASDIGGIPEFVENGVTGYLYKHDDPSSLARNMMKIIETPQILLEMKHACLEKARVNNLSDQAARIGAFYDSLIERRGSSDRKEPAGIPSDIGRTKRSKTKILLVSHLFPPYLIGGSEIVAYSQSKRLKEMGFEIAVFAGKLDNNTARFSVTKENGEFSVTRLNLHNSDFDTYAMNFDKPVLQNEFRQVLEEFCPDVVHFHNIYPFSIRIIEECAKNGIPTLMTLHDYWGICFKTNLITDDRALCDRPGADCKYCRENFIVEEGEKLSMTERNRQLVECYNKIDLLLAPSSFLLNTYERSGIRSEKLKLMHNGIDLDAFSNLKKDFSRKIRFGYIGNIGENKGIDKLLAGIRMLGPEERKRITCTIIGSGDEFFVQYCKRLAREFQIDDCVQFQGGVAHYKIGFMLSKIDVLLIPSVWFENAPNVIFEAFATGTPVLASGIGGIPEFIEDGITGFLHRYDDPAALAKNMGKIIEDPKIIAEMRQNCLKKARENDIAAQVNKIAGYYESLSARRSRVS